MYKNNLYKRVNISFRSFHGTITAITDFIVSEDDIDAGCYKLITLENDMQEIVNFIISPDTYFLDNEMVFVGDKITGYYDGNAPVPLIYPPQYRALIVVKDSSHQNVKVDYFNSNLTSSDGMLKINICPCTRLLLRNNQSFSRSPANRNLIVVYGTSTRSIPAQTAPYKVIIWC
ncbi:hypothetical protein [Clostridium isatidis]|uniref:hypothetical protein n=1 Tax=Clostridium isatidis TaxID=182773 RepID=UPI001F175644|nr:hypothetical protein [Clostridium isatidis]